MKLMVTDMGESNKHKVLVEYALRFIKDSVGEELSYFIETDINDGRPLPQLTMEGYRPDVFFEYNGVMFIGEAKTSDDILREHSINQYYSYLKKCSLNQGHATFVLAGPLEDRARANNILGKIKKEIPGDYEVKAIGMIV